MNTSMNGCRCAKHREVPAGCLRILPRYACRFNGFRARCPVGFGEGPRAADEELLALALEEQRIPVTEDEDFGELVFVRRLPHPRVIRFVDMPVVEKVAAMREER